MANKLFQGKDTRKEEMREARAVKAGKVSPKQYVTGEKSEGEKSPSAKTAQKIKSGALSPSGYAAGNYACGGPVKSRKKG